MRTRTFTVPFAKVVGDDAQELEFGPDDYLVVRPIFSMSAIGVRAWTKRIDAFEALPAEAMAIEDAAKRAKALDRLNTEAGQLILDLMDVAVLDWHLASEDGPIDRPRTVDALDALPGAIRGSLYSFLCNFRGDGAEHPTPLS